MRITYWTILLEGVQILHPLSADLILFEFNHSKMLSCSIQFNCSSHMFAVQQWHSCDQQHPSEHEVTRDKMSHVCWTHYRWRPPSTLFALPWPSHPFESPSTCDLLLIIPAQSFFWHLYIWVLMTFLYRYLPCTDHFWGAILLKKWCTYL